MSRITDAFSHGKAFIPFLTCGDPDLETTEAAVRAMAQAGADLIELGIPFSDPTAEGPVIQAANQRALAAGTTTGKIFEMVRRLRKDVTTPMVFMTYANVVFSYGTERFVSTAAEAGMDGLILPDVPYEEKGEFAPVCRKYGLDFISLIAPTSEGLLRLFPGGDRRAGGDHHRCGTDGPPGQGGQPGPPLCRRLRRLHSGPGGRPGPHGRRSDCGFRHRYAGPAVWPGGGSPYPGLCSGHEGRPLPSLSEAESPWNGSH